MIILEIIYFKSLIILVSYLRLTKDSTKSFKKDQDIPCLSCISKDHYCAHKGPQLDLILTH